ncbi:probable leucine-rich repeat receptor-like protein kinase At1g35710, partial [Eucalyptus grandis]|uniref:probable leucine-rich repeat receptor-like protein kinase At1g35710 n=1 Tax=Eucalyptus grandis TaxID=71139 RepID=UPI00192E998E
MVSSIFSDISQYNFVSMKLSPYINAITITIFASSLVPAYFNAQASNGTTKREEAHALLEWKSGLDNSSQALLSSWQENDPCIWRGIGCDGSGSVSGLNLTNMGLQGSLSKLNFTALSNLISLNLSANSLYGSIPPSVGNLSKLSTLSIFSNSLSGTIPLEIGKLSSLSILYLDGNHLRGTIPEEMGMLHSLSSLTLYDNNLTGRIPTTMGKLSNLTFLALGHNNFIGPVPPEMCTLSSLTFLSFQTNKLTGSIPSSIGNLSSLNVLN